MAYYERMEVMNMFLPNKKQELIDSSQLSYAFNKEKDNRDKQISDITNNSIQRNTPHISNEIPAFNSMPTICSESAGNETTNTRSL